MADYDLPGVWLMVSGGFILLLCLLVSVIIYNLVFHPLAKIPGPNLAAATPIWLMRSFYRRRFSTDLQRLHNEYGNVVRIGPNELSFATITSQKTIYTNGKGETFCKAGIFQDLAGQQIFPGLNLFTIPTNNTSHSDLKRQLQPAFTNRALLEQEPIHQLHLQKLISQLDDAEGPIINLPHYLNPMLWDVVGDLSFGEPLVPSGRVLLEHLKKLFLWLTPLAMGITGDTGIPLLRATLNFALACIFSVAFTLKVHLLLPSVKMREWSDRQDGRQDFITAILKAQENLDLSFAELHSNAILFLFAGYETTATTLAATFYLLLNNSDKMQSLQNELRSTFNNLDAISSQASSQLPYLNGCIQEALRLIPPVIGKLSTRISPGATIDGIFVPPGVQVSSDVYSIQRSSAYWQEPNKFKPERWLGTESKDDRSAYRPFLMGPRVCLGRDMALQTVRLTLAKLAFRYDFERVDRDFNWERDASSSLVWTDFKVLTKLSRSAC